MKVMLIEPPFHRFMGFYRHYFPLGLAFLASKLASKDHTVKIYDAEHDANLETKTYLETTKDYIKYLKAIDSSDNPVWTELEKEIAEFKPELVGISVLTVKVPSALKIASLCHNINEEISVVVGGEHPTVRPQDLLKSIDVDFAIRGEGEETISELIDALDGNIQFDQIDGLSFKIENQICHNKNRQLIENLDNLPFPARGLLAKKQTYRPIDFGLIMGSRGCNFKCTFCPNQNLWGQKIRFRSSKSIINEINTVCEDYSTKYFSFRDYSFSSDPRWTLELCNTIKSKNLDIEWECITRPDLINEKILSAMRDAGCTTIRVGIESGSQKILNDIRKDLSINTVKEMAKILNHYKFYWSAYFMFGLPSETEEDIKKTLELIEEIDPPFVTMARFTPLPNTEIYDELLEQGMINESEIDWGQWGNQWLKKNFSGRISQQRFEEIINDVAYRIDKHNSRNSLNKLHPLLKSS